MSDPTSNDRPTNDRPTNGRNPNAHLADLASDAETGSAADAKKVAADARASATQGPNRAAAAGMPAEKPQDLAGSVKRLAGLMGPERIGAIMVVLLAIVSITLSWYIVAFGGIVFLLTTVRWIADTRRDIAALPLDHQSH